MSLRKVRKYLGKSVAEKPLKLGISNQKVFIIATPDKGVSLNVNSGMKTLRTSD